MANPEFNPNSFPDIRIARAQAHLRNLTRPRLGDIIGHQRVAELIAEDIAGREKAERVWEAIQRRNSSVYSTTPPNT